MNAPWLTATLAVLCAGTTLPAAAELLRPIDMSRQADVNRKVIAPTMLNSQTLSFGVVSQPTATLPQKTPKTDTVATTYVTASRLPTTMHPAKTLSFPTVSKQNFQPKRLALNATTIDAPVLCPPRAAVRDRTIRAFTPTGEEELKQQLRKIH